MRSEWLDSQAKGDSFSLEGLLPIRYPVVCEMITSQDYPLAHGLHVTVHSSLE